MGGGSSVNRASDIGSRSRHSGITVVGHRSPKLRRRRAVYNNEGGEMFVPKKILALTLTVILLILGWSVTVAADRNPLPFPDRGYQVFTASSPDGMDAMVSVMSSLGNRPRFRLDSEQVRRALFWDGTIVNHTDPELFDRLGRPAAAMGFVVKDPSASALATTRFLRERGFSAVMIEDAEPGLPITFVTTDALTGAVLVFRKHQLRMGKRPEPWNAAVR
jgi:hypothetical protein